jgi:class 3 adenylate cyclase/tetratricopeptide (TPR) repeat protein
LICQNCRAENRPEAKFCQECGSPLGAVCPNGHAVPPGARFCDECGAPVGGPGPNTATSGSASPVTAVGRASPVAERRLVSVLFADLVGFTTLSESRDAEEVRELLTRYFDTCRRIIELYGGSVEKFIGDAVMAVWGAPTAQEDDAERSVRAALDLVQAVSIIGEEVGAPDLRARAGVLTGEAAVTIGAAGQGMVAGDLVNTASRIQSVADPGSVYVGESTRRASEAAIVYEDAGSHELKGKAEPLPLWRAVRVVAGARGALKSEGLEAPFVGRDRELRTVKDLFFACAEDRKAHLLSVIGVAGIGKSRLSWEFYKYFDGLPQITWSHRGRCLAYGEGVTYWALAEMVRMRARIAEGEEQSSALAKLRATVEEHVPDEEERKWVEPRLAHLIGLEDRVAGDREDLFAAWRLFFERLADQNPTLLIFEDMHWADASLLDFIEYLLDWSRNHPIYVVTLARPEVLDHRPNWGAGKRNFTPLYLEPLPAEAMQELLSGLVPGLPEGLRRQIQERAGGVPLYAVETVRMLLDRGLLALEGSVYSPTGPIDALEVPETLQALVAARLDGLRPEERRLVQDASAMGKTFTKDGLSAIAGLSEPEVDPLLTSLVRKEILFIQADARSPERGQYGFLQDLMRRVAYDTVAKKERKAKHLAIAAYLESAWGTEEHEIVEVIASHYLEAYRAAPSEPDAAGIKTKARDTLTRAGSRAASLAASAEAQRYFEQAASLADDPSAQAQLVERAGEMAWTGGRAEQASAHYERAIELFDSAGQTHSSARVAAALGEAEWAEGRIDEGIARMEQAFSVLSGEEPDEDLARLAAQLGRLLWAVGRTDQASGPIEFALEVAETLRLPEVTAQALSTKANILQWRGHAEESLALATHALKVALENDISSAALRCYNNLGFAMQTMDRYQEALDVLEPAVGLARRVGNRPWEGTLVAGSIYMLILTGRWEEALARAAQILGSEDLGLIGLVGAEMLMLAQLYVNRGELTEAHNHLDILRDARASDEVQSRIGYALADAEVLRAEGRHEEALAAAEIAIAAKEELGIRHSMVKDGIVEATEAALALGRVDRVEEILGIIEGLKPGELTPYLQAQGARLGARLAAVKGEVDRVEPGFKMATGQFREMAVPFWMAVSLLEHGEWLISQQRTDEAEPLLAEAREVFERLQARPWLERLDKVWARPVAVAASSSKAGAP